MVSRAILRVWRTSGALPRPTEKQAAEEQISAEMSRGNMAFTELHLTVLFASMLVATIIGSGLKNAAKLCKTWNNITNLRMLFVWVS